MKIVIIGGVAGGATAAARIRRLDEKAEIIIFERTGYISYANCGLPYYIGGVITDGEELTLQTPQSFKSRFNVDVRVLHEVMVIYPDKHEVEVKNLQTGETFTENYDKLLLSPGAKPLIPEMKGLNEPNVFTLRTVEDTFKIKNYIDKHKSQSVIMAGGGFIGLETAENLRESGLDVTIVQSGSQLMKPFDGDMAAFIHAEVRKNGVNLVLNNAVTGFERQGGKIKAILRKGEICADFAIFAIGVTPESSLAKAAGLELGIKGAIVVNDRMETSAKDIYAVGDAVQVKHFVTGGNAVISLAGPANKQGRIAADNICGGDSRYMGSQGSSVLKAFSLTAACTGINEGEAKRGGIEYEKVILSPSDHASYYPNSKIMVMKVLFEKNTYKILGAQIVGYNGVDKCIDVLATALRGGITAVQLKDLDLAYAPPYSSAKDPVNLAGYIADNIASGTIKQLYIENLGALQKDKVTLLDTRTNSEYADGHIEGFINIPVDDLRERINELDKDKPIYIICQSGLRSYVACRILTGYGFKCYNIAGGYGYYSTVAYDKCLSESASFCGIDK